LFFAFSFIATAAEAPRTKVALKAESERQPAPAFALKDAAGRTVSLKNYRGKVVLLDFWATTCGGCKVEIPWFTEFHRTYQAKGLAVVGVSLDEEGWKVVKPFLADGKIPYRILLGNDALAERYGITAMPDTFLIDRKGRVAAAYTTGLVDKDNVEANIKTLLARKADH